MIKRFLITFFLFAGGLFAQQIPVNQGTVDLFTYVTDALTQLGPTGAVFVDECTHLLFEFGAFMAAATLLKIAFGYWPQRKFWEFLGAYLFSLIVLTHWTTPFWFGYDAAHLLPEIGRWMVARIEISGLNDLITRYSQIAANLEQPAMLDFVAAIMYTLVLLNMGFVELALFVITSGSFIAIAIGIVWGPIAALAYLWRPSRFLWDNWIAFMIKYVAYRPLAAIMVYVWATIILTFLDRTIHVSPLTNQYSLGDFTALIIPFTVVNVAAVYWCLQVPHIAAELTQRAGHAGGGFGFAVLSRVTNRFR